MDLSTCGRVHVGTGMNSSEWTACWPTTGEPMLPRERHQDGQLDSRTDKYPRCRTAAHSVLVHYYSDAEFAVFFGRHFHNFQPTVRFFSTQTIRRSILRDRCRDDCRPKVIAKIIIIIIIIINDSIYPAVSKASRTGNKVSCQPNDCPNR